MKLGFTNHTNLYLVMNKKGLVRFPQLQMQLITITFSLFAGKDERNTKSLSKNQKTLDLLSGMFSTYAPTSPSPDSSERICMHSKMQTQVGELWLVSNTFGRCTREPFFSYYELEVQTIFASKRISGQKLNLWSLGREKKKIHPSICYLSNSSNFRGITYTQKLKHQTHQIQANYTLV